MLTRLLLLLWLPSYLSCASAPPKRPLRATEPVAAARPHELPPLGFDPTTAPSDPAGQRCRQAQALASRGALDEARQTLELGMAEDWAGTSHLHRLGHPCLRWLEDTEEGWFLVARERFKSKLRRAWTFGMPVVREHDGNARAGVYLAGRRRFVPSHPYVDTAIAAYAATDSRRTLVVLGRRRAAEPDEGVALSIDDFGFRIYETTAADTVAAQARLPWDGRLRIALEPDRALFVASDRAYPFYELRHGQVSEHAYAQFQRGYFFDEAGSPRVGDPQGASSPAGTVLPRGDILELGPEGLLLHRESTTYFVVDGPALDLRGELVPLGEARDGLVEFVSSRAVPLGRVALTLYFERCAGARRHRVVVVNETGEAAPSVLAEGLGTGLALYDLEGNLYVQSDDRVSVFSPEGERSELPPGLLLLSRFAPRRCAKTL